MRWLQRLDAFQQRHRWLALPIAVNKRFGEHDGSRLAAVVSYYSFFSVFPLLLVFVTVLGIVLDGNPDLRQELLDSALAQIPLIGSQLTAEQSPLEGNMVALVIGVATALWAGMGAIGALQQGLDELGDVPRFARPSFAMKRVKAVAFLVAFGAGIVASVVLGNLVSLFDAGSVAGALGLLATFLVNLSLMMAMFKLLPARRLPIRALVPGAVVAAVGLLLLQQLGSYVVRRFIAGASDTYGTFAVVIALLSWFHLVSRLVLLSAELNVVLAHDLSPRSLTGSSEPTDGDRRTILLDVRRVQRDPRMGYAVVVGEEVGTNDAPLGVGSGPES
jgi:membrane protein